MPLSASSEIKEIKNALEQEYPWIFLCEVTLPPPVNIKRITGHVYPVTFNGHVWEPWPLAVSGMKITSSGEMMTAQVLIGNAGGWFDEYLNDNAGLIGYEGNIYKLSKAKLDDPTLSAFPHYFKILTSALIGQYVTFNLNMAVDVYGVEGLIVDYDMVNTPTMPYGAPRFSQGAI
jgi:hypothetical protein